MLCKDLGAHGELLASFSDSNSLNIEGTATNLTIMKYLKIITFFATPGKHTELCPF